MECFRKKKDQLGASEVERPQRFFHQPHTDMGQALPTERERLPMLFPGFSDMPKIPIIPGCSAILTRTKLGQNLYKSSVNFNLDDPDCHKMSPSYNSFHDPCLHKYYHRRDKHEHLKREKFITKDDRVMCSVKDYNTYKQYLDTVKSDLDRIYKMKMREKMKRFVKLQEEGHIPPSITLSEFREDLLQIDDHNQNFMQMTVAPWNMKLKEALQAGGCTKKENSLYMKLYKWNWISKARSQLMTIEREVKADVNKARYYKEAKQRRDEKKMTILEQKLAFQKKMEGNLKTLDSERMKSLSHVCQQAASQSFQRYTNVMVVVETQQKASSDQPRSEEFSDSALDCEREIKLAGGSPPPDRFKSSTSSVFEAFGREPFMLSEETQKICLRQRKDSEVNHLQGFVHGVSGDLKMENSTIHAQPSTQRNHRDMITHAMLDHSCNISENQHTTGSNKLGTTRKKSGHSQKLRSAPQRPKVSRMASNTLKCAWSKAASFRIQNEPVDRLWVGGKDSLNPNVQINDNIEPLTVNEINPCAADTITDSLVTGKQDYCKLEEPIQPPKVQTALCKSIKTAHDVANSTLDNVEEDLIEGAVVMGTDEGEVFKNVEELSLLKPQESCPEDQAVLEVMVSSTSEDVTSRLSRGTTGPPTSESDPKEDISMCESEAAVLTGDSATKSDIDAFDPVPCKQETVNDLRGTSCPKQTDDMPSRQRACLTQSQNRVIEAPSLIVDTPASQPPASNITNLLTGGEVVSFDSLSVSENISAKDKAEATGITRVSSREASPQAAADHVGGVGSSSADKVNVFQSTFHDTADRRLPEMLEENIDGKMESLQLEELSGSSMEHAGDACYELTELPSNDKDLESFQPVSHESSGSVGIQSPFHSQSSSSRRLDISPEVPTFKPQLYDVPQPKLSQRSQPDFGRTFCDDSRQVKSVCTFNSQRGSSHARVHAAIKSTSLLNLFATIVNGVLEHIGSDPFKDQMGESFRNNVKYTLSLPELGFDFPQDSDSLEKDMTEEMLKCVSAKLCLLTAQSDNQPSASQPLSFSALPGGAYTVSLGEMEATSKKVIVNVLEQLQIEVIGKIKRGSPKLVVSIKASEMAIKAIRNIMGGIGTSLMESRTQVTGAASKLQPCSDLVVKVGASEDIHGHIGTLIPPLKIEYIASSLNDTLFEILKDDGFVTLEQPGTSASQDLNRESLVPVGLEDGFLNTVPQGSDSPLSESNSQSPTASSIQAIRKPGGTRIGHMRSLNYPSTKEECSVTDLPLHKKKSHMCRSNTVQPTRPSTPVGDLTVYRQTQTAVPRLISNAATGPDDKEKSSSDGSAPASVRVEPLPGANESQLDTESRLDVYDNLPPSTSILLTKSIQPDQVGTTAEDRAQSHFAFAD